ncbi:hypothetical protein [Nonomuraea turkmeniaca]|uniref:hypothetical protein n=1 Tax=Nonomuraea turkmeniaca TaxID=103838 RepID=UPI001476E5C0|nr:hypothetical protein [Nonomuraea turkmeniaca]
MALARPALLAELRDRLAFQALAQALAATTVRISMLVASGDGHLAGQITAAQPR